MESKRVDDQFSQLRHKLYTSVTNGDGMCDTRRIIPVRRAEIEFLAAAPHAAVRLSLPPATRFESINMFIRELDITQRYGPGSVTLFMPVGTHPADAKIVWFFFFFFAFLVLSDRTSDINGSSHMHMAAQPALKMSVLFNSHRSAYYSHLNASDS